MWTTNRILATLGLACGLGLTCQATATAVTLEEIVPAGLLTTEATELKPVRDALQNFEAQVKALQLQAQVTKAQLDQLRLLAEAIKRQLPTMQRALESASTKLKGAGKWTPELDAAVLEALKRAGRADIVQGLSVAGGYRAAVQKMLTDIMRVPPDLDNIVAQFQPKTAVDRLLESVLGVPVSAAILSTFMNFVKAVVYATTCATTRACT